MLWTGLILIHIRGRDCVALEARYHKRCYQRPTKLLSNKPRDLGSTIHDRAFERFCSEIIEERIFRNKEVLLLSYPLKQSVSYIKRLENVNVPYQAERLKNRIKNKYPHIVFHASNTMNRGGTLE